MTTNQVWDGNYRKPHLEEDAPGNQENILKEYETRTSNKTMEEQSHMSALTSMSV